MVINLDFDKAREISMFQDKDYIRISFITNMRFMSVKSMRCIDYKYTISAIMPPQLDISDGK
jgi:hypothetical protein